METPQTIIITPLPNASGHNSNQDVIIPYTALNSYMAPVITVVGQAQGSSVENKVKRCGRKRLADPTIDPDLLLKREKNRVAAKISNNKKTARMKELERAVQELRRKNRHLACQHEELKSRNGELLTKNEELSNNLQNMSVTNIFDYDSVEPAAFISGPPQKGQESQPAVLFPMMFLFWSWMMAQKTGNSCLSDWQKVCSEMEKQLKEKNQDRQYVIHLMERCWKIAQGNKTVLKKLAEWKQLLESR